MKKILSLTSKDFLSGITEFPYTTSNGFWSLANNFNPFSRVGTIQPTTAVTSLSSGTIVDLIQNFVPNASDLYGIGGGGHFYKIATFYTGTPVVTDLRSGTLICDSLTPTSLPANGLEIFRTKKGTGNKLYYWSGSTTSSGFIGEWDLSSTYPTGWNDKKFTITNPYSESSIYPTLRINDEIFYGSKYVVSEIYDNSTSADPVHLENILDLPKDHTITSLETDGYYLIISAIIDNANESRIYFWDYKNELDSWTISYSIKDNINKLKNVGGVIYAVGNGGLYAFNSGTAPTKIRTDIKNSNNALYNIIEKYNDSLIVASTGGVKTYGKVLPNLTTGVFNPLTTVAKAIIMPPYITGNPSRLFFSSGTVSLDYLNLLATPTATEYREMTLQSAVIDLGNSYKIGRVDVVFVTPLASGQNADTQIILLGGYGGGTEGLDTITFQYPSYTNYGGVRKCKLTPVSTSGDMITDTVRLQVTTSTGGVGTNAIKRIDIYGEETE